MIQQMILERKKTLSQKTTELKKDFENFLDNVFQPSLSGIKSFQQKIALFLDKGDYIIKTAQDSNEVFHALKLRHDVFYEEILHKKNKRNIDFDRFDSICDHLMVIDKISGNLIGTYRFNSSLFSDEFYSSTEFDISNILKLKGNKLELGRACIDKNHRNGITISLLWTGISEYLKASDSQYLFGCSSIKTTDFFQVCTVYKYLKDSYFSPTHLRVTPRNKFKVKRLEQYADFLGKVNSSYEPKIGRKLLPSLVKTYLRAGALVCGEPALDKDFNCIDVFTLMDVKNMQENFSRKFEL